MPYYWKKPDIARRYIADTEDIKSAVYHSGKNAASIWLETANFEKIKAILTNDSCEYLDKYNINFTYKGAMEAFDDIIDDPRCEQDYSWILRQVTSNTLNMCYYVLCDLMKNYHEGVKDGVREICGGLADKIIACVDTDKNDEDHDDNG